MNVVVVGGGIAGLTTALRAEALGHTVALVVKGLLGDGCTAHAQGGIAGVYGADDSPALHALDTLQAGDGHGDAFAITTLVDGAEAAISALQTAGVGFDRDAEGALSRGLEAAHSRARIAHAGGDATGAAISAALVRRVLASSIVVRDGVFAADLIIADGRVRGIRSVDRQRIEADAVVLATGGAGRLFAHTTNPASITADGIAMALRAGAAVADLEFTQFHPTVLADGSAFLLSEAVRGAGAVLRDADGRRFLIDEHRDAELAPRDIVARAVARRAADQGAPVRLDATALGADALATRFPTIDAHLRRRGIDWSREQVPVTPAAHYLMGGIVTDLGGRTTLPGLWAVGETARTGVHGANRLASNSLLEGAVFGARVAESLGALQSPGRPAPPLEQGGVSTGAEPFSRAQLQKLMWEQVGLVRTEEGLRDAVARLHAWDSPAAATASCAESTDAGCAIRRQEDANLLTVARAMASAALARTDSLGAHFRLSPALIGAA